MLRRWRAICNYLRQSESAIIGRDCAAIVAASRTPLPGRPRISHGFELVAAVRVGIDTGELGSGCRVIISGISRTKNATNEAALPFSMPLEMPLEKSLAHSCA
jgi:hypothetical protein